MQGYDALKLHSQVLYLLNLSIIVFVNKDIMATRQLYGYGFFSIYSTEHICLPTFIIEILNSNASYDYQLK